MNHAANSSTDYGENSVNRLFLLVRTVYLLDVQGVYQTSTAVHLRPVFADVLEDLSNIDAWEKAQRQDVQGGRKNKLPFPRQDRRAVGKTIVWCSVRV